MLTQLIIELLASLPSEISIIQDAIGKVHSSHNGPAKVQAALDGVSKLSAALSQGFND